MKFGAFYAATLILQVVILFASHVGLFWAVMIMIAANLHALALVVWKE